MTSYLLFDVGGTDIKYARSDAEGNLLDVRRAPTARNAADPAGALIAQLRALGDELLTVPGQEPVQPEAVGLLVCGIVDEETGHGVYSANLGWRDAPLRDMASQAFGLPVGFGHDVGTAGAAELHFGAGVDLGAKIKNSAMLVIGTGIAAALFADGRPITAGGYAGELGHAAVPGGLNCPCGLHGCLETVGSAAAIANRYAQASGKETPGAREVLAAMHEGDLLAAKIWTEAIDALAYSITQICAVIAPEVIIIGGGLSQAGDNLLVPLRQAVRNKLSYQRVPEIVAALLGQNAGLRGAYLKASKTRKFNS